MVKIKHDLFKGKKIIANTNNIIDLNDITKAGLYYCEQDSYAPYIIHCPWSNGTATPYTGNKSFFLFVEDWGTNKYSCKQTLTYYNSNNTYVRTKSNSTTWTNWKEFNTNNNDYLRLATRVIAGEAISASNIIGGSNDSKYYKLKSGLILDTRYPILFNTSAITSGSFTDNTYNSHTGVPLTNNVSGKTVTNQKQVYIEGTSYDGKLFTVSDRVFVSDDQINSTTDLGKYYIYIGVSYSTTNIRFNSFHQTVYVETRNGLVPVGDNTHNPHMLVKGDAGTAGYFKFLTIRTQGTYHDQTIEFDTTHRGNKPKTVVSFNFNTYEKTSGSKQYYTNIQAFYYHGHPTPVYYIQTNDGVQDATFDFYIRRETWDEMGVSDLRSSANNYSAMTVTWHNDFVTALPSGTTQATLNPYYAQVGHTHGSIANNGQLNSDITSVNKVAVTDSSNNLKTISQLPYSKISGTPTIPTKTSQLTNDSNFTTATGHTHSYLPSNANGTTTGTLTATKFINSSSNNTNILLGNGNTLAQSTFATSGHTHNYLPSNADGTTTGNITATTSGKGIITANQFKKNGVNNTNLLTANGGDVEQSTFAKATHNQASSTITEGSALGNLGTGANASQSTVNSQINSKMGAVHTCTFNANVWTSSNIITEAKIDDSILVEVSVKDINNNPVPNSTSITIQSVKGDIIQGGNKVNAGNLNVTGIVSSDNKSATIPTLDGKCAIKVNLTKFGLYTFICENASYQILVTGEKQITSGTGYVVHETVDKYHVVINGGVTFSATNEWKEVGSGSFSTIPATYRSKTSIPLHTGTITAKAVMTSSGAVQVYKSNSGSATVNFYGEYWVAK